MPCKSAARGAIDTRNKRTARQEDGRPMAHPQQPTISIAYAWAYRGARQAALRIMNKGRSTYTWIRQDLEGTTACCPLTWLIASVLVPPPDLPPDLPCNPGKPVWQSVGKSSRHQETTCPTWATTSGERGSARDNTYVLLTVRRLLFGLSLVATNISGLALRIKCCRLLV